MKANPDFSNLPLDFWANVRLISQVSGYSDRKTKNIKVFSLSDITEAYKYNKLNLANVVTASGTPTGLGQKIIDYSRFRADFINNGIRPNLMRLADAKALFDDLFGKLNPKCGIPANKQKGEKSGPAYLTGIVNMIIEANIQGLPVNYDPRLLTSITEQGAPIRTLSRRVDGAFPDILNPIAIWEIKEYYYTTTFGSRVADGVYETQLDGYELTEIRQNLNKDIEHYLIVDDYFTWWEMGRSYLCRICDMMHNGTLTEALFGREVVTRLPRIVSSWIAAYQTQGGQNQLPLAAEPPQLPFEPNA